MSLIAQSRIFHYNGALFTTTMLNFFVGPAGTVAP